MVCGQRLSRIIYVFIYYHNLLNIIKLQETVLVYISIYLHYYKKVKVNYSATLSQIKHDTKHFERRPVPVRLFRADGRQVTTKIRFKRLGCEGLTAELRPSGTYLGDPKGVLKPSLLCHLTTFNRYLYK